MRNNRMIVITILLVICCLFLGCGKENGSTEGGNKGSIYGTVTDFATGDPVAFANVQLRPSGETTLTGYDGTYEFLDIPDGNYSIKVSKAEYTDLIDNYEIVVKNGRRMRRDVQIEKKPTFILTDSNEENDISMLDFGSNVAVTTKSFKIFNNGTVTIHCQMVYSCSWISSVSSVPDEIIPGQTVPVTVSINRSFLSVGQNSTQLVVSTNNGSAELTIKATSGNGNPPNVELISISNITATSALCKGRVRNANGSTVSDCGFCYSTHSNPTLNDNSIRLGPCNGTFEFTLSDLEHGTTYYIKAFASSNLGTGLSLEESFSTATGLPNCGATTITHYDPTTVTAQSSAYATNGYDISEKGFCWSETPNPTINDYKVAYWFGGSDGTYHEYINPLQPNTTYHIKSYAKSVFGISYGPEMTFTSLSGFATVTTKSAYLSGSEVVTGGDVTFDAGTAVFRGVCYGSSSNPDISSSFLQTYDGSGMGSFTSYIPKPMSSGYLYIRAYATTKYGTAYGNEVRIYIP